jgi:cupin 2 domain-containing protein
MAKEPTTAPPTSNVLAPGASPGAGETVDVLLSTNGVRLERIVSRGEASPAGFWYDQAEAEWVTVLTGRARLTIEGETNDRELGTGDSLFLPAHCRHRVAWTAPDQPTIWLALFLDARLVPRAGG